MNSDKSAATKRKVPLFYIILSAIVAVMAVAVIIANIYIGGWLREYESAQPKHTANSAFGDWFYNPDFEYLLSDSGYALQDGETLENALAYFTELAASAELTFCQVSSAFEERADALVYMVRAGDVNLARFTLVPSGLTTKYGHVLYQAGDLMMIRRNRPAPPPPEPEPEPEPLRYSTELQSRFSSYVLEAVKTFSKRSRNKATKEQTLVYYEPGSDMYLRIDALSRGYNQEYASYKFEDEIADEFVELPDGAFSCRVRYSFIMKNPGQNDYIETVDYTLFLRPNENGQYLIYDQYVTGAAIIDNKNVVINAPEIEAALYVNGKQFKGGGSAIALNKGDTVDIEAKSPFQYVYLIWDNPAKASELETPDAFYEIGRHGYFHELIALDTKAAYAKLKLGESGALRDIQVFGAGVLPDWVQIWQPTLAKADLVAFSTHADDEHLFFGGILPTYAGERKKAVQVVYLTYHRPERTHELLDGLWTVGVTAYPVIGPFADSISTKDSLMAAEAAFGRESVVEFQVEMLRRFKPAVVVGQDLDGEYGHGAHMLNARTLAEALELSGDATNYPHSAALYGVWDVPKAYLHLYPENQIVMDWNLPLAHFNGKTAFEMAEAGFAMHKSQTGDFAVQQSGTWQDCRKFGLYRTTVGPDIKKDDLFENIL